jgi:hypothetical protein|tara:strand:- start:2154 stop:3320 length:1167 start_codon:yes stop_codon:yes gene_type:complete
MKNWIEGFMEYIRDTESPRIFSEWTAYSMLASAMERRVYLTRGHVSIFPDLYVILVARSGMRKSTAAKIAINDIMRPTGLFNVISTIKMTAEALYKELSNAGTMDHSALIFADELQTFLGSAGFKGDVVGALTLLYDSPESAEWRSLHAGIRIVERANVNMLACTTNNYVGIMLPRDVIECGFAPRVMWITASKPGKKWAWGSPEVSNELRIHLRNDLSRIKNLVGRATVTREAHHFYLGWYNNYHPKHDPILEPYFLRKGTTVLKLAMILRVANVSVQSIEDFIIEESDISESLEILKKAERSMAGVYNSSMGDLSKNCERILDYMEKKGKANISHAQMAKALYRHIRTAAEFKESIEFLIEMRRISLEFSKKGSKTYSILVEENEF